MGTGSNQYKKKPSGSSYSGRNGGVDEVKKSRGRGRPRKNEGRDRPSGASQKGVMDQEMEKKKLTLRQASHLVDKNSKTLVKLAQTLELKEKFETREGEGIPEAKDWLARKINMYKNRISRRLEKLAAWADDPRNEDKQQDKKFERTYFQESGTVNVQRKSW